MRPIEILNPQHNQKVHNLICTTCGHQIDMAEFTDMLSIKEHSISGMCQDCLGLGFQYGWRGEYKVARKWGVGVEMFGEIEDLSHSGPFDDQTHSIGPTLFYNPGGDDEDVGGEGDEDEDDIAGAPEMEFSFNVGLQFGLTDAASDTALKFQGALEF